MSSEDILDGADEEAEEELADTSLITEQGVPLDVATLSSQKDPQKISLLNDSLNLTSLEEDRSATCTTQIIQEQDASRHLALGKISAREIRESSTSHAQNTPPEDNVKLASARIVHQDSEKSSHSHACCRSTSTAPPRPTGRQTKSPEDNMKLASATLVHQDTEKSSPSHACCRSTSTAPPRPTGRQTEDNMEPVMPSMWHQDLESRASGASCSAPRPDEHSHDDATQVADSKEDEGYNEGPNLFTLFPELMAHYPRQADIIDKRMSTTEVTRTLAQMHTKADFSHMKQASRLIPPQRIWLEALEESLDEAEEEELQAYSDGDGDSDSEESDVDVPVDKNSRPTS